MTKTETFLVIEQDQEIVRFNERLRQLRAFSPEQRIKYLAARAHQLRVEKDRRLHLNKGVKWTQWSQGSSSPRGEHLPRGLGTP